MTGNFRVMGSEEESYYASLIVFYERIRQLANKAELHDLTLVYEALSDVSPTWNIDPNPAD